MSEKSKVIIVGAGIYGMSTALWMLEEGGYDVTILDRAETLPAPDAASCDLNKIIRAGDYADPYLAQLAVDAVDLWRKPEWKGTYHESGVIALAHPTMPGGQKFVSSAYTNCLSMGISAQLVTSSSDIRAKFPGEVSTGSFGDRVGYANPIGGWAEAGRATLVGLERVQKLGGKVLPGKEVVGMIKQGREVRGVRVKDGEEIRGDLVVVCAGAWTPGLFALPEVKIKLPKIEATGQSLAILQLTPEEQVKYAKVPVIFNLDDGWYIFPPNADGLMKMAIHAPGYTNPIPLSSSGGEDDVVSVPRTKLTPGAEDGMIPREMLARLRSGLAEVYPDLQDREYVQTRLCWYCDTHTGDWLIDYHPDFDNLVVATGDSGHAFKYAPIIGREILRVIKREPIPEVGAKWSFGDRPTDDTGADHRDGVRQVLRVEDLARAEDLKVPVGITVAA